MHLTIPEAVVDVRAEICAKCPSPCEHQANQAFHAKRCSVCPLLRWSEYGDCTKPEIRGLGDLVHSIANPIARAIDTVAGTHLAECGGCKQRREALNRILPRV